MKKIVLLYWGKGGNVEDTAHKVYNMFDSETIDMFDVASFEFSTIENYDLMILGHSTIGAENWNDAEPDNEWNRFFRKIESNGNVNILAASFGLGNQILYPDHFVDGLGIYKGEMDKLNIKTIGSWPSASYKFTDSDGEKDGFFYGLALDIDNETKLSDERINEWTKEIKKEMGI
jgi:flavodoxin I